MSQSHYIVYERDAAWQFTNKGSITAPFDARADAIAAAILAAQESGDPEAIVIVQDHDTDERIVWRRDSGSDDGES